MKMQNRKFLRALLMLSLVAVLLLSFAACGKKKKPAPTDATTEPTLMTEATQATDATTAPTVAPTEETTESTEPTCEHPNAKMVVDKNPTCRIQGSQHMECEECEYVGPAEVIEKIDHISSDWILEREATCLEEGNQYIECTMCKTRIANARIPKTGHTPGEWILDKQATNTEPGKTHQECDICKEVLDTAEIPTTGTTGLAFKQNQDGQTYTVTGIGTCKDTVIYIPGAYEGGTVTAIGEKAFAGCTKVEKIILPNTVTEIGDRAFYDSGIKEFTIPASVKKIGTQIFFQADKLDTVFYNSDYANETAPVFGATWIRKVVFGGKKVPAYVCQGASGLSEVVIGKTVTEIGNNAFEDCTNLSNVTIPDSVSAIGEASFAGCSALSNVTIPDSVTRINKRAFAGCSGLYTVTIPASMTKIGEEAFSGCKKLQAIDFQGTQAQWDKITKGTNWDYMVSNYTINTKG